MRKIAYRFSRIMGSSLALGLLLIPPTVYSAWAAVYLRSTWEHALSPGVPLEFEYQGKKQKYSVRAERFSIDLSTQTLVASDVSWMRPDRSKLAHVDRVTVKRSANGAIEVLVPSARAQLKRLKDGSFEFDQALPPAEEPAGEGPPVSIDIRLLELDYQDFARSKPLYQDLKIRSIKGAFAGSSALVSAVIGPTRISFDQINDKDWIAQVITQNENPKPWITLAESYLPPDIILPSFKSGKITTQLKVFGSANAAPRMYGNIQGQLNSLEVDGWWKASSATFQGGLSNSRYKGTLALSGDTAAAFDGTIDWEKSVALTGNIELNSPTHRSLAPKVKELIPKEISWNNAQFQGPLSFNKNQFQASGDLSAAQITFNSEQVAALSGQIRISPDFLRLTNAKLNYEGSPLSGFVGYGLKNNQLSGRIRATNFPIHKYASLQGLRSNSNLDVALKGTPEDPQFAAVASGPFQLKDSRLNRPLSGLFQAQLSGNLSKVDIQSLGIRDRSVSLNAAGSVDLKGESLDLKLALGNVSLGLFNNDLKGRANASGTLTGSFKNPKAEFLALAQNLKFDKFTAAEIRGKGSFQNGKLNMQAAELRTGASFLTGTLAWDSGSGALSGTFDRGVVEVAEWPELGGVGKVNLINAQLSGTAENPSLKLSAESERLDLKGVSPTQLKAQLQLSDKKWIIQNIEGQLSDAGNSGTFRASGTVDSGFQSGDFRLAWNNLPLGPVSNFDPRISMDGLATGALTGKLYQQKISQLNAQSDFNQITLDGVALGSGYLNVSQQDQVWNGGFSVGALDRFLVVDEATFDERNNQGKMVGSALNLNFKNLAEIATNYSDDMNPDLREFLKVVEGNVSAQLFGQFNNKQFSVQAKDVVATDIKVRGNDLGQVNLDVAYNADVLEVAKAEWLFPSVEPLPKGQLRAKGRLFADGRADFDFDASNIHLNGLPALDPNLPSLPVTIETITASIGGTTENPTVLGSALVTTQQRDPNSATPEREANLFLDVIELKDNLLRADGKFQAFGFTGDARFQSPLAALQPGKERTTAEQLDLELTASPRPLSDFSKILTQIDDANSKGSIQASIKAKGTIDDPILDASFEAILDELKIKGARTGLLNSHLKAQYDGKIARADLSLSSTAGGTITGELQAPIALEIPDNLEEFLDSVLLSGRIATPAFVVSEGSRRTGDDIFLRLVDSAIEISGPLSSPLFKGEIAVIDADATIPPFQGQDTGPLQTPVNPRFDIVFLAPQETTLRSIQSSFDVIGDGRLQGSLVEPDLQAKLVVQDGLLKLPNARLELEQGGTIELRLQPDAPIQVPIRLTGRTSVTARRPPNRYERYDLTLVVSGDLADSQSNLSIVGSSDPGDLNQQEILAIVGQRELVDALVNIAQDSRSNEFQNLLLGYALPSLVDPVTGQLADTFGFDYLNLEYNPFEGPTIAAARSIGKHFTIQARRRIPLSATDSALQRATDFEVKLVYRIPSRNTFLSRSRLSLSNGTDRPWRLAFEYSFRF